MSLTEFDLIRRYFTPVIVDPAVHLGVGDDGALLAVPAGEVLVVSVDTHVAGVHFPPDSPPDLIAQRALRAALSDLAAMGATPRWFTLALTMPLADADWLENFSSGLLACAQAFDCTLVGGDTTRGPLTISLQVMGSVVETHSLRRTGAQPGDKVYVSGMLGDPAGALACMQRIISHKDATKYVLQRFYLPALAFDVASLLHGVCSAAIDISDGLLADLQHICESSGCGAQVMLDALPISPAMQALFSAEEAQSFALNGGEDFELCFTVPPQHEAELLRRFSAAPTRITCIGEIVAGHTLRCVDNAGQVVHPLITGYKHF